MIKVVTHRILVKPDKLEEANKDYVTMKKIGLIIPQSEDQKRAQASVDTGVVIEVGPTAFRDFGLDVPPIKHKDKIAYARFAGKYITDPETEEEFIVLNDEDVICILHK